MFVQTLQECEYLKAMAKPLLQISTVVDAQTGKVCMACKSHLFFLILFLCFFLIMTPYSIIFFPYMLINLYLLSIYLLNNTGVPMLNYYLLIN